MKCNMAAVRHLAFVGEAVGPPTEAHSRWLSPVKIWHRSAEVTGV